MNNDWAVPCSHLLLSYTLHKEPLIAASEAILHRGLHLEGSPQACGDEGFRKARGGLGPTHGSLSTTAESLRRFRKIGTTITGMPLHAWDAELHLTLTRSGTLLETGKRHLSGNIKITTFEQDQHTACANLFNRRNVHSSPKHVLCNSARLNARRFTAASRSCARYERKTHLHLLRPPVCLPGRLAVESWTATICKAFAAELQPLRVQTGLHDYLHQ